MKNLKRLFETGTKALLYIISKQRAYQFSLRFSKVNPEAFFYSACH